MKCGPTNRRPAFQYEWGVGLEAEIQAEGERPVVRDVVFDLVIEVHLADIRPLQRRDVVLDHDARAERLHELEIRAEADVEEAVGLAVAVEVIGVEGVLHRADADLADGGEPRANPVRDERNAELEVGIVEEDAEVAARVDDITGPVALEHELRLVVPEVADQREVRREADTCLNAVVDAVVVRVLDVTRQIEQITVPDVADVRADIER